MNKKRLYLDMDNVLAHFDGSTDIPVDEKHVYGHKALYKAGFFLNLPVMPGATEFVSKLIALDLFEVYVLTQPFVKSPRSYTEKVKWIAKHFPVLEDRIIMTQDKLLVKEGILIDDSVKWSSFKGDFILFEYHNGPNEFNNVYEYLVTKYQKEKNHENL